MEHLPIGILCILFIVGGVAGLIDALSGGGGLLTLPTLLTIGLPPTLALGTNRLQGCVGELTAAYHFIRKKHLVLSDIWPGLLCTSLGAIVGAVLAQSISHAALNKIIPILMTCIIVYTLVMNTKRLAAAKQRFSYIPFTCLFGVLLGVYNGFFWPRNGIVMDGGIYFLCRI